MHSRVTCWNFLLLRSGRGWLSYAKPGEGKPNHPTTMNLSLAYAAPSFVEQQSGHSLFSFAPNLKRAPVFFDGFLRDALSVRDALLCLHDVVQSDFDTRISAADWERILDPVATVARDQLFFEAFSQDESSYGRVAVRPGVLQNIERWESGTTNVDFTPRLAAAIGAIRSGKDAHFKVDPEAFAVRTDGAKARERKVKLPPSWLRGFLNVQSAMTGDLSSFELGRADLRNLLAFLKTHKETFGPRALVFRLTPGERVEVTFEPWNHKIVLGASVYHGDKATEVRVFGRRRLFLLNRVLPKTQKLRVFLCGSGLPSFWLADLNDDVQFQLAISGWTTRPFAASGLHLSESQTPLSPELLKNARESLRADETLDADALTRLLNIAPSDAKRALSLLCAQGQAMFDLDVKAYRKREVVDVPLDDLGLVADPKRLVDARALVSGGKVKIEGEIASPFSTQVRALVSGTRGEYHTSVTLDGDGKIVDGDCECAWFNHNALRGGPCKHILGVREAVSGAATDVAAKEEEWWRALV